MNISKSSSITDTVLMIKPIGFSYNTETAVNNYYQKPPLESDAAYIQEKALKEFENFVSTLKDKGINVIAVEDTSEPATPDSVFPNNWISFHEDGSVAIYPMFAENRRRERREDILTILEDRGFQINKLIDYSKYEYMESFLEGTGSMNLDRSNKKVYCALSPRSDYLLLEKFCGDFDYTPVVFTAYQWIEDKRLPICHIDTFMALGERFAIICSEAIDDIEEREKVLSYLKTDGKTIIDITEEQAEKFAGNALQLKSNSEKRYLILSKTAKDSLTQKQIDTIEESSEILSVDIETIQNYGGGGVRCMMAEIFLPKL